MIGVLTASTESGNVLGYDLGDKREKEQRIQILDFEGVILDPEQVDRLNENWTDSVSKKEFKKISREVANDLSRQFDAQTVMSERIVKTTGHIALSFSPADAPRLEDPDFRKQLAREYMEAMGITDTQWVFTWHFDTRCPHGHIAYNRVRNDGTVIDSKNERYRSLKVATEITKKYGLAVGGEAERNIDALCDTRHAYAAMRQIALVELANSCTLAEYTERLRKRGITLLESSDGLSYSSANGTYPAKGSKLDRAALSYSKVTATLSQNLSARQAAEAARQTKADAERALAAERRKKLEELAHRPVTFVIRNENDATLYVQGEHKMTQTVLARHQKLDEATRSILSYKTFSASIRRDDPTGWYDVREEIMSEGAKAKMFGTVSYDLTKARFIVEEDEESSDKILEIENPHEAITFRDATGRVIDLITTEFLEFWTKLVRNVKEELKQRIKQNRQIEQSDQFDQVERQTEQKKDRGMHL